MEDRNNQTPIIIQGVTYTYPEQSIPALKDINLEVQKGEYLAIMGPNGAGKTTLCLLLNGILPNVLGGKISGHVKVAGLETRRHHVYSLAQHIGIVLQDPEAQLFTTNVRSEVAFAAENLGVPRDEMIARIDWALKVVRLEGFSNRAPSQLSGGQKQRLAIASALVMRPIVLVLDEPTSQLDPVGSQEVFSTLRELNQELGMTIVTSTHQSEYVARHADRILVLEDGRIIALGTPSEVFSQVELLDRIHVNVPAVTRVEWRLKDKLGKSRFSVLLGDAERTLVTSLEQRHIPNKGVTPLVKIIPPVVQTPLIMLKDVSFHYPHTPINALENISISIGKGEFVGIIGQNGAGKTTLVKNIIGLLKPTSGQILIGSQDTSNTSPEDLARTVGLVLQNPDDQLFAMTVGEEVAFGAKNLGVTGEEVEKRVNFALKSTGLEAQREKYPFNLSFGDRRKLSVAAVVSMMPEILIFDEPTTGQDYQGRRELANIGKGLNEQGHTVIMITHDMDLIAAYTRRLIVMGMGKVLLDGPTVDVFQQVETLKKTFIEPPQVTQLALALGQYGVPGHFLTVDELVNYLEEKVYT